MASYAGASGLGSPFQRLCRQHDQQRQLRAAAPEAPPKPKAVRKPLDAVPGYSMPLGQMRNRSLRITSGFDIGNDVERHCDLV